MDGMSIPFSPSLPIPVDQLTWVRGPAPPVGCCSFTGTEAKGVQPPEAEANGAALVVKFDRASGVKDTNSRSRGEAQSSHNTPDYPAPGTEPRHAA